MTNATPSDPAKYFRATGAELREWSATDPLAAGEMARRAARKATKVAAKVAA